MVGGPPKVARFRGKIAIFSPDDGGDHGFLLTPDMAITLATRVLAAVADAAGRDKFTVPVQSIELTGGATDGTDLFAKLVLTIDGAPLAVDFTATQVAELAAGFTAAARALDRPEFPRADR